STGPLVGALQSFALAQRFACRRRGLVGPADDRDVGAFPRRERETVQQVALRDLERTPGMGVRELGAESDAIEAVPRYVGDVEQLSVELAGLVGVLSREHDQRRIEE